MNERVIYGALMILFVVVELRLWAMHDTLKEIRDKLKVTNIILDRLATIKRIEELENERMRHV